jgi:ATP-dependent DNA ligase
MPFKPMLASACAPRRLVGQWVMEPKFDGWRVIVAIDGDVRVWKRRGHDLTARLPELAGLADVVDAPVVLDGELVAGQGHASDFYGALGRVGARNRTTPLTFVAFDVLAFDGPVIDQPCRNRRALLDGLALNGDAWCATPQLQAHIVGVLAACREHDVEGIVAKRPGNACHHNLQPHSRTPAYIERPHGRPSAFHAVTGRD